MLIVQKYGGTSVANPERIKNVAQRVARYRAQGNQVVVVVSAMSGVTDNLIKMARELTPLPNEREMDMLLATGRTNDHRPDGHRAARAGGAGHFADRARRPGS